MTAPTNPNKALWEKGDFTRIAAAMRESGEALVATLDLKKGQTLLDLGCGDGTTAVPARRTTRRWSEAALARPSRLNALSA